MGIAMARAPQETRAKLLDATIAILVADGAAHLTLDAVAHQAQVSKGGLLHHFPTKEALLRGLAELAAQLWSERLGHELAQEPEGQAGRLSRAYIRATFDRPAEEINLMLALARVVSTEPVLLTHWREIYDQPSTAADDDGLPAGRALTIQIACDGLWFGDVTGMALVADSMREQIRTELLRLTR
jgi:AcrR family transcriptional regulator